MTTYVAFMRAINVAGHAIVKMTDLKDSFAAAGCKNVRTFIQSGNIIFECDEMKSAAQFKKIRSKVKALIGSEPAIVFRTLHEVEAIVKADPFSKFTNESALKLYVVFLFDKPQVKPKLPLVSAKEALEAIAMKDREVFIVSRRKANGFYGFPNNFIEQELGVIATSRNWSTVSKIAKTS